jgi:hypothetical protein
MVIGAMSMRTAAGADEGWPPLPLLPPEPPEPELVEVVVFDEDPPPPPQLIRHKEKRTRRYAQPLSMAGQILTQKS